MFSKRLLVAAMTAVLIAGLGACGGGGDARDTATDRTADVDPGSGSASGKGEPAAPKDPATHGLRDEVRHRPAKTTRATRPHMVKKCATTTRRVKHTSSSGSKGKRHTRTWYSTEKSRHCEKVRSGTETYKRVVRPEQWCVRLDDVDGDTARDDTWFQVSRATYDEALAADEHARLEFTPTGNGC
ncbi:hypothetical protein [Streptomyces fructofermentans]|uniref:Lipoprotein n=1 Tax=Streptomyces fructofermentans TaxID=152141 RepID=A0A918NT09_9ACTN|nr:hypothetical protein [Streptomyces fructofermentans]GGX93069.1 hypothetical protein GCM10010515_70000 [Streptomyces fructofermentans]